MSENPEISIKENFLFRRHNSSRWMNLSEQTFHQSKWSFPHMRLRCGETLHALVTSHQINKSFSLQKKSSSLISSTFARVIFSRLYGVFTSAREVETWCKYSSEIHPWRISRRNFPFPGESGRKFLRTHLLCQKQRTQLSCKNCVSFKLIFWLLNRSAQCRDELSFWDDSLSNPRESSLVSPANQNILNVKPDAQDFTLERLEKSN